MARRYTNGATFARIMLAALMLAALALAGCSAGESESTGEPQAAAKPGELYVCPMNCVAPLPVPADCPVCGMDLVVESSPVETSGERASEIVLSEEEMVDAGIRLAPAERRFVNKEVVMFGTIEYDPGYFTQVDAFTSGIIDEVYVRRTGQFIRQDEKLFDFYSEEIYELELELLEVAEKLPSFALSRMGSLTPAQQGWFGRQGRTRQPTAQRQIIDEYQQEGALPEEAELTREEVRELQRRFANIRFRLRSYGLYDSDINDILRLRQPIGIIPVRIPTMEATVGGVVIENNAFPGRYVDIGTPLMTIADTHYVWCQLEAFESDFPWLRYGQTVEFSTIARPGEIFTGEIEQIDPVFDSETRTFNVGVVYEDDRRKLRPSMLVRAKVQASLTEEGRIVRSDTPPEEAPLVIPAAAPLITGRRAVVYVADPANPGVFRGREIVLGPKAEAYYLVEDGLEEGELVVVDGTFKIDSELQIQARPSMMQPQGLTQAFRKEDHGAEALPVLTPSVQGEPMQPESRMPRGYGVAPGAAPGSATPDSTRGYGAVPGAPPAPTLPIIKEPAPNHSGPGRTGQARQAGE
jgi:Cu(I)/Ag(I) efflux system membrane fusion protein